MKMEHEFHAKHGFTGSAGKEMRPTIPGYKHGGGIETEEHGHVKHAKGAKEHHGKSGHKDHDGEMHKSKVKYDKHGFQHHCHGGKV